MDARRIAVRKLQRLVNRYGWEHAAVRAQLAVLRDLEGK
jgi:hypothetical protein